MDGVRRIEGERMEREENGREVRWGGEGVERMGGGVNGGGGGGGGGGGWKSSDEGELVL